MQADICIVYVARPGHTPDNYSIESGCNRWSRADETPLSEQGEESARKIAEAFKEVRFDAAYCSKAERTRQTAMRIVGTQKVDILAKEMLYEMKLGPLEGKTPRQIIDFFSAHTHYPHPSTKETLPKLWAKRGGKELTEEQANDCLLDKWHEEIDTFDRYSAEVLPQIKELAVNNIGRTILLVPHGTPMKSIVADAEKVSPDTVKCGKGSYYVAVVDSSGNIKIKKDLSEGLSIE